MTRALAWARHAVHRSRAARQRAALDAEYRRQLDELEAFLTQRLDRALAEIAVYRDYIRTSGLAAPFELYATQRRRQATSRKDTRP